MRRNGLGSFLLCFVYLTDERLRSHVGRIELREPSAPVEGAIEVTLPRRATSAASL